MIREEEKSRWWWFESHKSSKHSQWLQSTLAELDSKTKAMLKLIEGNADSFAQRAETYYKKRPELITIVEDFYRAHRSLAEKFDHLKSSDHGSRSSKFYQESIGSVCDSNSQFEDADSEIEDPQDEEDADSEIEDPQDEEDADSEIEDPQDEEDADSEIEDPQDEETASSLSPFKDKDCKEDETTLNLEQEERLKLIQESDALRKQLLDKDEEKREVIRQLSLTLETLKDENLTLKRRLRHHSPKKPLDKFFGKLFYILCDGNKVV